MIFFLNHEWKIKRRNLTIKDCIYSKPLENLRFFLLRLFLVDVCTSVCVPRGIHAGDQRSMSRVLYSFLPYFLKQVLSLSLESTDWVDLLLASSRDPLLHPALGCAFTLYFALVQRIQIQVFMLVKRHFPD